jgi:hypothetical protein
LGLCVLKVMIVSEVWEFGYEFVSVSTHDGVVDCIAKQPCSNDQKWMANHQFNHQIINSHQDG